MYDRALQIDLNDANIYSNKGIINMSILQELHFHNKENLIKRLQCMIVLFK